MRLRLTNGEDYSLTSCKQECEPETGENLLTCTLTKEYDFEEIIKILKMPEIAEIITVYNDDNEMAFQSKDYKKIYFVEKDISTGLITIKFSTK